MIPSTALPGLNWALVVPMANEADDFAPFIRELYKALEQLHSGKVYLVVDTVSRDRTLELCEKLSAQDARFVTVWSPENKNLAEAYQRGYREAWNGGHKFILEMDAGLSHDPAALPKFLEALAQGTECAWGSRFIPGGVLQNATAKRRLFSRGGTLLANLLLGTSLHDMTSGYQGFPRHIVALFKDVPLKSSAHFYQTELRYLLRKHSCVEIPIVYKTPSPRLAAGSIINSISCLLYYTWRRFTMRAESL